MKQKCPDCPNCNGETEIDLISSNSNSVIFICHICGYTFSREAKGDNMSKKNESSLNINGFIKGAIKDAIIKALRAKPVRVHYSSQNVVSTGNYFEIDGEIFDYDAAIEKILGEYSWWNEK